MFIYKIDAFFLLLSLPLKIVILKHLMSPFMALRRSIYLGIKSYIMAGWLTGKVSLTSTGSFVHFCFLRDLKINKSRSTLDLDHSGHVTTTTRPQLS